MRVQGGLRPEDWQHWGHHTTFKGNAGELLRRELRPGQVIYCSPLTDPYQPAEAERRLHAAQDALRMGYVNRVVARGELEAAVREECALLAANAPLTMTSVKVAIDEICRAGPQIDAARIEEATRRAYESQDFIEGRQAFMQKRKPVFQGR
jgi:hypothetical protein